MMPLRSEYDYYHVSSAIKIILSSSFKAILLASIAFNSVNNTDVIKCIITGCKLIIFEVY